MPTWRELYRSISTEQRTRSLWCFCHLFVAAFTLYSAQGSLALTALSHLIVFDALGASLCVAVDVLSNFEVWKRSSIRHPFGLERAEVLAGFAMSVFLLFMGFDIISHCTEHLVEGLWKDKHGHSGGHVHEEHLQRISAGSIDFAALAALAVTTVSAILLKNHARIGRGMFLPRESRFRRKRKKLIFIHSNALRGTLPPPLNPLQSFAPPHPCLLHTTSSYPASLPPTVSLA